MNESDTVIWEFAKTNDYTIVTHDSDFNEFSLIKGYPPKIIWLKTGNMTNDRIIDLLLNKVQEINDFLEQDDLGCLELY
jgi:predicted nuclease of predicted toxin-antitoxin system